MAGLLEREDELLWLARAVQDAVGGTGCVVLLAGEAGIGKTSLVRAWRDGLAAGVSFVSGGCEALSVPVPLAPLRELVEAAGGDAAEIGGGEDRVSTARAVLGALAERAPMVAVIEDAHWADPLTLDVLRILARRVEACQIVVVVTYRDDEVGANPALGLLLGDLATAPAVRRIALGHLSPAAVGELAAGSGLDPLRLVDATAGNPFLVVEAIAAGGRLPASVRDAALARAGRLSPLARQVVDAAAVIGQSFESGVLAALAGECSAAVQEALARGVLIADGTRLGFRHELIREALEGAIAPPRRAELHARLFSVLAGRGLATDSARLAHHAELGGLTEEAARYAMLAAAEAERVGAPHATFLQAERALRLGHALEPADRFELLVRYALAANFANPHLQDAVDAAERAVALAERLNDDRRRGRALTVLSYALWSLERVVESRAAAQGAIDAFDSTSDVAARAWAHATLLRIEATSFDPGAAVAKAAAARELAEAAGLEEVGLDVEISVGLAMGHRGDGAALAVLADALNAARRGGFTIRMVRSYVNLTTVAVALREHAWVDRVVAEALPLLDELHVSALPIMGIRAFAARSLLDRGRWDEALAVAASRERWWQGEHPVARAMEGLIKARRGQAGADDLLRDAWTEIVELVGAESARHGMIRLARVESAWLRDDRAAATDELRAARASPAVARFARSGGELALWGARLGVALDVPAGIPEAVGLELNGDWRRAIDAWRERQAPYEAALAALPGDDRAAGQAMATLHQLGAAAAVRAFARERSARGGRPARGPRRSTLAHPAGLTRREQEVLEALLPGASNAEIATQLHLSERTVAHHVSAILAKLGARNRHQAVDQARRRGLLAGEPR
ncbi:MAG TPA: LuxR C-terminal-related transcriptional regulator [Solirubrobacteraceae bacterium]|nr:LuxR C-terminal-related transcriptional regulator [Solirubrobacteraceae bacterium]